MTRLLRAYWPMAAVSAAGAAMGGAYAWFIGCRTGTCPLTSSVPASAMVGAVFGVLACWPGRSPR